MEFLQEVAALFVDRADWFAGLLVEHIALSAIAKSKSATSASSAIMSAPANVSGGLYSVMPRKMATPKPPAPMNAAMPATEMVMTTMERRPARITLVAMGNRT